MVAFGPASAFFLVGGRNLSTDTYQLVDTVAPQTEQVNGLSELWERHLPVGLANLEFEATGGIYDDRVGGNVEAFQGKGAIEQLVDYGFAGGLIGAPVSMFRGGFAATWKRIAERDGLTKANALYKMNGPLNPGRILHGLTAETATGSTEGANALDNNANPLIPTITIVSSATNDQITTATPHGLAVGNVVFIAGHVGSSPGINGPRTVATVPTATTFTIGVDITVGGTGGTVKRVSSTELVADLQVVGSVVGSWVLKVRHSADNTTYTDLLTFTTVTTGTTTERLAFSGTVQRYLALSWTLTPAGSDTITPYVAVFRN